jgi:hypothetical protein
MKPKNVVTLVCCTLLIATAVLPVKGIEITDENKVLSCELAPTMKSNFRNFEFQQHPIGLVGKGKTVYGYQAYPTPPQLVSFDLDVPGTLNVINSPTSTDFIAGGTWVDGTWWGCEYAEFSNSNIWTIDHVTGDMNLVGASGSSEGLNGLAYDDTTSTMFAASGDNLFTIDMATGSANLVGAFGSSVMIIGIACDSSGNLYGECLATDSLYSIDKSTGIATLIGSFGGGINLNYAQDMAIDKDSDICYLAALTIHAGNQGDLYTCDLATGIATKIGMLGTELTEITGFAIPYIANFPPDKPETPDGPNQGFIDVEYEFTTSTTDPDENQIKYGIDWDSDFTVDEWTDLYNSGDPCTISHSWSQAGVYDIRVKAKDPKDAESEWSDAHTITIVEPPAVEIGKIEGGLLKVSAKIKNPGGADASGVSWSIELSGGLILLGKTSTGTIDIPTGGEVTVESNTIIGIGQTTVTVKATIPESFDRRSASAFVFVFFIII